MKTRTLAVTTLALAATLAAGAASAQGKIYLGAKLGMMDPDIAGFDNVYVAGVYGGFNLLGKDSQFGGDLKGGTLAVEGEGLLTTVKGKTGYGGKWEIKSLGVYAAYRYPLTEYFYLKGKAGVVHYEVDTDLPPPVPIARDTGTNDTLSAGVGAGWKIGPGSIEVEATTHEGNVLLVSGGFHMSF